MHILLSSPEILTLSREPWWVFIFDENGQVVEANFIEDNGYTPFSINSVSPLRVRFVGGKGQSDVLGLEYSHEEGRKEVVEGIEKIQKLINMMIEHANLTPTKPQTYPSTTN